MPVAAVKNQSRVQTFLRGKPSLQRQMYSCALSLVERRAGTEPHFCFLALGLYLDKAVKISKKVLKREGNAQQSPRLPTCFAIRRHKKRTNTAQQSAARGTTTQVTAHEDLTLGQGLRSQVPQTNTFTTRYTSDRTQSYNTSTLERKQHTTDHSRDLEPPNRHPTREVYLWRVRTSKLLASNLIKISVGHTLKHKKTLRRSVKLRKIRH